MKKIIVLLLVIFVSCKQNQISIKHAEIEYKLLPKVDTLKKTTRGFCSLKFNDNSTFDIISNWHTKESIDSISRQIKAIKGKYINCGKSALNKRVFNKMKEQKEYLELKKIHTAHNVLIKNDTLYLSGKTNNDCFEQNDSIFIKSIIFTLYQHGKVKNLMIIDSLIKL